MGKYYEQLTHGKRQRLMYSKAVRDSISEEVYNEIYKPYRRYTYAGKPTRVIKKLNKRAEKIKGVNRWLNIVENTTFENHNDLKKTFPSADYVVC